MNILKTLGLSSLLLASASYAQDAAAPAADAQVAAPCCEEQTTLLCADIASKFYAEVEVAYNSMYVFRGLALAEGSVQPGIELGYEVMENTTAYIGFWNNSSLKETSATFETDFYAGVSYTMDAFTFNVGYTCYSYPGTGMNTTNEIGLGVSYDTSELIGFDLAPSLAYYYDFNLRQDVVELAVSYSMPVLAYVSWDSSLYGGYVCGSKEDGIEYGYVGFSTGATVTIVDGLSLYLGVSYAYNGESEDLRDYSNSNVWFSTSLGFAF